MQQENTTVTAASYAITSKDPSDVSAGAQDISGMALIVQVNIPGFLKTGLVKISTHSTTWQIKQQNYSKADQKPFSEAGQ